MPEVSVVIPAYNAANCITSAIDSVLVQTYDDIEVIVVDDGSTDDTRACLQAYGNRVRYIYQDNQERSTARNTGVRHARGRYIAFLDADDYWLPTKLERQMAIFRAHPETGMVYGPAYAVDAYGHRLYVIGHISEQVDEAAGIYCRLLLGNFIPSPTPLVRRECCQRLGGFDETLRQGEDWDYWLRVARHYQVRAVTEPLACHRVTGDENLLQKMAARGAQMAHIHVIEKAQAMGGCSESVLRLAFALAWFRGALIDLGLGQVEDGQHRLQKALEYETHLFSDREDAVLDRVANLAAQLCQGQGSAEVGEDFIRSVWMTLPSGVHSSRQMRKALSTFYASQFFQGNRLGDRRLVRASLWPMIINGPQWLRNRGVWSIAIRAFLNKWKRQALPLF